MAGNKNKEKEKILMVGNPNVGKSALFNRLTGADATVSNYPGTTVDYTKGIFETSEIIYEITDVPGMYSLEPKDGAEEVALKILENNRNATVFIVLDATRVERGLYLALEIIEKGYKSVMVINMIDSAHEKGVSVDIYNLQKILGIPVITTSALSGEGLPDLTGKIRYAQKSEIELIEKRAKGEKTEEKIAGGCAGCGLCGGGGL
jgi:ferrous iron transport protein B